LSTISCIPKIIQVTTCLYKIVFAKSGFGTWQNLCGEWKGQCMAFTSRVEWEIVDLSCCCSCAFKH